MATFVCPYVKSYCGGRSGTINFDKLGDNVTFTVSLPPGETCLYKIMSKCGLPAFTPNQTNGFDFQSIDYDDDDGMEVGDDKAETKAKTDKKAPPATGAPKRDQTFAKRNAKDPKDQTKGPQKNKLAPTASKSLVFKGGKQQNSTDEVCGKKMRHMLVAVTNLAGVDVKAARILQNTNNMVVTVGTTDFQASYSTLLTASFAILIMVFSYMTL
jgi:hypothetical protein